MAVLQFPTAETAKFHALIAPFIHPSMEYKLLPRYRGRFAVEPLFRRPNRQVSIGRSDGSEPVTPKTFSVPRLAFGYALGSNLLFPLLAGGSCVLFKEKGSPQQLFEVLAKHRPTVLITRMFSLIPGIPGRRQQAPRTSRSMRQVLGNQYRSAIAAKLLNLVVDQGANRVRSSRSLLRGLTINCAEEKTSSAVFTMAPSART